MRSLTTLLALVFLIVGKPCSDSAGTVLAAEKLTYPMLVKRMIDLEGLSVLPAEGERCAQWSSYDRSSRFDVESGKYIRWHANSDGSGIIRREGDWEVLAEMDGPGCIWRIWSALAQQGHVKIFLDGAEQPAVDLPFIKYFEGKNSPFDYPMLSYEMKTLGSRGENLYYPIPYRKSCKIVAEKGWGRYYQSVYTTFPPGTEVPAFTGQLTPEDAGALRELNDFLQHRLGDDPAGERTGVVAEKRTVAAAPGRATTVAELAGPRGITALRVVWPTFTDRAEQCRVLRNVVLKITFDDLRKPAVWCPLGDFFGTAPGVNPYKALITGMTEQSGYAYWYMPFARKAKIELISDDPAAHTFAFAIEHAPLRRPMEQLGYFHCYWHRDVFPLPPDRFPDWTMLRTAGRGRFCGVMLHVWNPRGDWWGEGDEKFFVDGEKFPSIFGTGSEDYFGYAWCHPGRFERPYHAQSMTEKNAGHQSVLRWHIADNIPFQRSFEAVIEKYFPNDRPTVYACTVCWYLSADGENPFDAVPASERWGYCIVPPLESEGGITVEGTPPGSVQIQRMGNFGADRWSNNDQLWWTKAKPGDKLTLVFPVEKTGTHELTVTLTKARDYGIVQLFLDDKKLGEPIDLFHAEVVPTGPISLGKHVLEASPHKLTVEIVGANPQAVKAYMFGLDRIVVRPVE